MSTCRTCMDGVVIYHREINGRVLEFAAACVCARGAEYSYLPRITEVMPREQAS